MELARDGVGSARKAALQALALLVEDKQLGMMVQFVVEAKTEAARADAAEALTRQCKRQRAADNLALGVVSASRSPRMN